MSRAKPFRFGLQAYQATSAEQWRTLAREAEQAGYSAFHLADHYFGPGPLEAETRHPVQDLAAIPAMAVAAEATSTIRIGCRVLCVDYHVPAVLAKELATLDLLSDGIGSSTADATDRKTRWIHAGAGARFERLELEIAAYFTMVGTDPPKAYAHLSDVLGLPPEASHEHPHVLAGSVDEICDQLEARRERYGISYATVGARAPHDFAPVVTRPAGT